MIRRSTRIALCLGALLGLGAWEVPSAHSGAAGASRDVERPPGHAGPRTVQDGSRPHACRVCRAAARHDLRMTPLFKPRRTRCGGHASATLRALAPSGRLADDVPTRLRLELGVLAADLPEVRDQDQLTLEFRVGAASLGTVTVPTTRTDIDIPVPPELRARLRGIRGCVRWGRFDVEDPSAQGSFWLDPPERRTRGRLAALDRALATEALWVRATVRAQAWLDEGFPLRALEEARSALAVQPDEPHAVAVIALAHRMLRHHGSHAMQEDERRFDRVRRRRPGAPTCDLDRPLPASLRARVPRPRGGCGH